MSKKRALDEKRLVSTLEAIYRARFVDEKMQKLVWQNKGTAFHLFTGGHELIGVVSGQRLMRGKDWAFPYYRDRAFTIGLGASLRELFGAFLAREVPHHSGGRMMPDHFSHKGLRIPCQSSVVGSQFLQAVGVAQAIRLADGDEVVYVSGGDGATSQGDFHEALNYACLHHLSVIFVIQDNGWAISVPAADQIAGRSIADRAKGYAGLAICAIDGCDYGSVDDALSLAVERGREMRGPTLIVAEVPRLGPHSSSDDPKKYRDQSEIEREKALDPLPRYERWLCQMGVLAEGEIAHLRDGVKEEVEIAAREAEGIAAQSADRALDHISKESDVKSFLEISKRGESIVIVDALQRALDEEMERDEGVVVFGQDVARGKGGVFGVTQNLTKKYGEKRCFNTPLAESTIIGIAIGLSIHAPFKPVAEIQFADYIWTGINQLFNELATFHYRSNGEWHCPLVIRMPCGGYVQGGPYHSQSIEAFLCHVPGIKVVIPSCAADAKMLLKAAIRDPNPVIFLEHKALYRQRAFSAQNEPTKDEVLELGCASIVRQGRDATVVCWGFMVHMTVEVARKFADRGVDIEIVDLRTLSPLDFEAILLSVEKTGRLLVLHEAPLTCGFGAEIAARVAERGFQWLDAPIQRLGGMDSCVPFARHLEERVLPQKGDLERALEQLLAY